MAGNGFLLDDSGDVYVCSARAVNRYQASVRPVEEYRPPTRILTAWLDDRELPHDSAPTVAARVGATFEATFSGLSFLNEERVEHQVRLVGYEPEWRATRVREARYPKLPPGEYRFEARARVGLGAWGEVASVSFRVPAR
jgi:hypothetical protein